MTVLGILMITCVAEVTLNLGSDSINQEKQ